MEMLEAPRMGGIIQAHSMGGTTQARFIFSTLIKHRRFIVGSTVVAGIAALITLIFLPPRYEVSAALLFKVGREMASPTALTTPSSVQGSVQVSRRPEDVSSEIEIMKSPHLLEKLVEQFGEDFFVERKAAPQTLLEKIKATFTGAITRAREGARELQIALGLSARLTPTEQVVAALQKSLTYDLVRRADVINVRLETPDPTAGVQILNKFLDFYVAEHIAAYKTPHAREFFEAQVDDYKRLLADAEGSRAEFKKAKGVADLAEQRRLLLVQQRESQARHAATLVEAARLEAEVKDLDRRIADRPREVRLQAVTQRNAVIDPLTTRLRELEAKRESLRGRFTDESRIMQDLTREIEALQASLKKEEPFVAQAVTSGVDAKREDLERESISKHAALGGLRARASTQLLELASLASQLGSVDGASVDLGRLDRNIRLLEQSYMIYTKSLEEARIAEAMDLAKISNVSVISRPVASPVPVWPPKLRFVLGALLLGCGGSITVAFVREGLRRTVRSREDVFENLGVPVLATVPESAHLGNGHRRDGGVALPPADEFRRLCREVQTPASRVKSVLVVGARTGEGTTTVAVNIARALAESTEGRVLLVDANVRTPALHELCNVELRDGLYDWDGASEVNCKASGLAPNLFVLTAGEHDDDAVFWSQLVSNLDALAKRLRDEYDFVVWDAPAVERYPDALILAPAVDGVLLVIESDRTSVETLSFVREQLDRTGGKLLGSVMNRRGRILPRALRTGG